MSWFHWTCTPRNWKIFGKAIWWTKHKPKNNCLEVPSFGKNVHSNIEKHRGFTLLINSHTHWRWKWILWPKKGNSKVLPVHAMEVCILLKQIASRLIFNFVNRWLKRSPGSLQAQRKGTTYTLYNRLSGFFQRSIHWHVAYNPRAVLPTLSRFQIVQSYEIKTRNVDIALTFIHPDDVCV